MKQDNKKQYELSHTYQTAQARISSHPEYAAKQKAIIDKCQYVKSDAALENAIQMISKGNYDCRVWANIEKNEEFYSISDQWIVTDDWDVSMAAEYLGYWLVYNDTDLQKLFSNQIK